VELFSGQDEVRTSNLLHLSWDFLHSGLMLQQLSHLADWKFTNSLIYNTSDKYRFFIQQFITVIYWLRRFRASNKYTKQNKQKRKAQNRREKNIREKRQHRAGDEVGQMSMDGASYVGICVRREETDWGGHSRCLWLVWGAMGAPWARRRMPWDWM